MCLSLVTMTDCGSLLRPISGCLVGGLSWEVGATRSFASMLDNNDTWQCVVFVLSRIA
jgi:hypothetical protein